MGACTALADICRTQIAVFRTDADVRSRVRDKQTAFLSFTARIERAAVAIVAHCRLRNDAGAVFATFVDCTDETIVTLGRVWNMRAKSACANVGRAWVAILETLRPVLLLRVRALAVRANVLRTGVAVVCARAVRCGLVIASRELVAPIDRTRIIVIAVNQATTLAESCSALRRFRADVIVVTADAGEFCVFAAPIGIADVCRTRVAVIAEILVRLAVAIIILAVAGFGRGIHSVADRLSVTARDEFANARTKLILLLTLDAERVLVDVVGLPVAIIVLAVADFLRRHLAGATRETIHGTCPHTGA